MKRIISRAALIAVVVAAAVGAISPASAQESFTFAGTHTYRYQAETSGETLFDGACPASATLVFLGGQQVMLLLSEYLPCLPDGRTFPLFGKVTPSGSVKLDIPTEIPIRDILEGHTGCSVSGPFPKYKGRLRDGVLHARTHFTLQCNQEWPANDLFETPVDGPVHGEWILDLEVVVP